MLTFAALLAIKALGLGYGVMVTQQVLVLFFLVRIRVSQQSAIPAICHSDGWFFFNHNQCTPYVMSLKGIALKDAPKRQQAADAELVGAIHTFFLFNLALLSLLCLIV